jgi:hypothetical protein
MLDTTFGSVAKRSPTLTMWLYRLPFDDGKMLVAGPAECCLNYLDFSLVRYRDGEPRRVIW